MTTDTDTDTIKAATDDAGGTNGSTELTAAQLAATVDRALAAYCDPDVARREATIGEVWAPNGELLDPPLEGRGHAELSAAADALLTHFPGHVFRRTTPVDAHHGYATYGWQLVGPQGGVAISGNDFAAFTPDGTIERIVGFFAPAP